MMFHSLITSCLKKDDFKIETKNYTYTARIAPPRHTMNIPQGNIISPFVIWAQSIRDPDMWILCSVGYETDTTTASPDT